MKTTTKFDVTIDGVKDTLQLQYNSGNNSYQYNTKGNKSAHTFNAPLYTYPKNTEIKTNGCIYVILN